MTPQELVITVVQLSVQRNEALYADEQKAVDLFYRQQSLDDEQLHTLQSALARMRPQTEFKFMPELKGNHVHCHVFSRQKPSVTFAKAGDIILSPDEWAAFEQLLASAGLHKALDAKFEVLAETLRKT